MILDFALNKRPVSGRECGGCTLCCYALHLDAPDFSKAAGEQCGHCTAQGCAIHQTRPDVCRNWFCLWRTAAEIPDSARPDRLGVYFSLETVASPASPFERFFVVLRAAHSPGDFDKPEVKEIINHLIDDGRLPVWVGFNDRKKLLYPTPLFAEAILHPESLRAKGLVPLAQKWRRDYDALCARLQIDKAFLATE